VVAAVEELRAWAAEAVDAVRHRKARRPRPGEEGSDVAIGLELATTIKRWLDLYGAGGRGARTPTRDQALRGAIDGARSPSEAAALYSLAFAGWCWREVGGGGIGTAEVGAGFESICSLLRLGDLTRERRWAAFAHGLALHDSEPD
jgi:hypothetical protein